MSSIVVVGTRDIVNHWSIAYLLLGLHMTTRLVYYHECVDFYH